MKCGPDQNTVEICEKITFLEKSFHFVVLDQVLMQSMHTVVSLDFLLPIPHRMYFYSVLKNQTLTVNTLHCFFFF